MRDRIEAIQKEIEVLEKERQAVRGKMRALRVEMDELLAKQSLDRKIARLSDGEKKALGIPVNVTPGTANLSAKGR